MGVDPANALRSQNAPREGDHVRDIDAKRTVATSAKHTVPPNEFLHLFQLRLAYFPPFLIERTKGFQHFIGRHVSGITVMAPEEKTTLGTESASSAGRKAQLHSAFFLIEHFPDLLQVNGCLSIFGHFRVFVYIFPG